MTYKRQVPQYVLDRWVNLNHNYKIDLSLDDDCIEFLQENFNDNISNLFKNIKKGMFKADLWRLCKLYKHNNNIGVYADVDLVPHISIDKIIPYDNTLYSCLSVVDFSIFQAFIVHKLKPNHAIFMIFIISFYVNKIYNKILNGATYDMYRCLSYIFNVRFFKESKLYSADKIKIKIQIGSCSINIKHIDLGYFDSKKDYEIVLHKKRHDDDFKFKIDNNILIVEKVDKNTIGWKNNYYCDIIFNEPFNLFLYGEYGFPLGCDQYVLYAKEKILDSRDKIYFRNNKCW